ncbi:MAG TPA: glycosyltransferase [Pseudobacteroides sp.]|uniref:glycosyltransferase n=1 Tax=Pseudobacteroides sp. TaxID=1968840 RepID=UPI002F9208D7
MALHIIYVSSLCSEKQFFELFSNAKKAPGQQVQKYHRLMVEGLSNIKNLKIDVLSGVPITLQNYPKRFLKGKVEIINDIKYYYTSLFNLPLIKNLCSCIGIAYRCIKLKNPKDKNVIICDVLNISLAIGCVIASKLSNTKIIGIVTDVPGLIVSKPSSFVTRINNFIIKNFNSYIFLTDQMNSLINKNNKPFVVIEGQVDYKMKNVTNIKEKKYNKMVCIYAGMTQKAYGIETLVKAFIEANCLNAELHIYGSGDYDEELIELSKKISSIRYLGVVPNKIIVEEETKATLLINPRPSKEEFTKYSFPSKNMEYMASGTPVLTTFLPGMPGEYLDYIYTFEDETVVGMAKRLREILSISKDELHEKGIRAKEFVLNKKNNICQAAKIIELINKLF